MNNWKCENCGGMISPVDVTCPYCGGKVTLSKWISPEDKTRMTSVAKIMSSSLNRNAVGREYRANRVYVYINMLILVLMTWLLFFLSSSYILTGIISCLMGVLIFAAYDEEYWNILRKATEEKIYEKQIKPAISNFLISFNYYGCDWEQVVSGLIQDNVLVDSTDFFSKKYASTQEKSGKDAVLHYASEELTDRAYIAMCTRKVFVYLSAGYIVSVSAILYSFFFNIFWIPLIWTIPVLVMSILLVADKIYIYALDFEYKYNPNMMKNDIIPLLKQYCEDTETGYVELVEYSKEIKLYVLHSWLEQEI